MCMILYIFYECILENKNSTTTILFQRHQLKSEAIIFGGCASFWNVWLKCVKVYTLNNDVFTLKSTNFIDIPFFFRILNRCPTSFLQKFAENLSLLRWHLFSGTQNLRIEKQIWFIFTASVIIVLVVVFTCPKRFLAINFGFP